MLKTSLLLLNFCLCVYIKFVKKTLSFRKHFCTVFTEEIRIAKFCTEVFVMPKRLMIKLNIPEASLKCIHSVQSFYPNNIAELLFYGKILFILLLYLKLVRTHLNVLLRGF